MVSVPDMGLDEHRWSCGDASVDLAEFTAMALALIAVSAVVERMPRFPGMRMCHGEYEEC